LTWILDSNKEDKKEEVEMVSKEEINLEINRMLRDQKSPNRAIILNLGKDIKNEILTIVDTNNTIMIEEEDKIIGIIEEEDSTTMTEVIGEKDNTIMIEDRITKVTETKDHDNTKISLETITIAIETIEIMKDKTNIKI